jgi:hypothetical protein
MNGRPITACALALAFLALSGRDASAQDRGQNRGQNRRPDTTRADTLPEGASGANAQGGHVTNDADRAVIAADEARRAAQAEQDRQRAMQGRSNNNDQDRNRSNNRDRADEDRRAAQAEQDRRAMQGRGDPRNRSDNDRDRSYSGQDRRFPRGEPTFTDQDRRVTRDWYRQHRNRLGAGWRDRDRLPPSLERRLRRGQRLDPMLRQRMYWLPPDLAQMYGPPPRGYRYAIIGGNIVLLDDFYNVHDVFRLEFNF